MSNETNVTSQPVVSLARQLLALVEASTEESPEDPLLASLSKRERQILALLNYGLSNAQLAQRCFISRES